MISDGLFIDAEELKALLDISKSKAYDIIKAVNKELKEKGYMVIQGKAPRKYLFDRIGCGGKEEAI